MSSITDDFNAAIHAFNHRDLNRAELLFRQVLKADDGHVAALNLLTIVLMSQGRFSEAEPVIAKAVGLNAGSDVSFYNFGLICKRLNKPDDALRHFSKAIDLNPNVAETWNNRGTVLNDLGQHAAALSDFDRALALNANYAEAYANKGKSLAALGRTDAALTAYGKSLSLNPGLAEARLGRGNVLSQMKRHDEAVAEFDMALAVNPALVEAFIGRGNALAPLARHGEALAAFDKALAANPKLAEAWLGRGNILTHLRRQDEAFVAYDKALAIKPDLADAWVGRGNLFGDQSRFDAAIAEYDKAIALKSDVPGIAGLRLFAKMQCCDWSDFAAETDSLVEAVRGGNSSASAFPFLAVTSSARDQLRCANVCEAEQYRPRTSGSGGVPAPGRRGGDKIRLGYFSADFRHHPVALLTAGLFECHDRSKFEVFGFSFKSDPDDKTQQRLRAGFDKFVDLQPLPDCEAHALATDVGLDIAVDLMGYTTHSRTELFTRRLAPIQVSYLGYPGTMGAPFIDYIVSDDIVTPKGMEAFYSEKIVRLPDCFQVNDMHRLAPPAPPTRADVGLPDDGFVFCCFNNTYKFNPAMFDVWMRLLQAVEHSVLWLVASETAAANLRRHASDRGIDPERLIISSRADYPNYLARFGAADLFVDTLPFNGGTTVSDALWAGLPVVTCTGEAFASRMAASLVRAAGIPELVAGSLDDYVALAVSLARDPERAAEIKRKLAAGRDHAPLFDTQRTTRHIEQAYVAMQALHRAGLPPEDISVPA
jgi:protein O-GlcNAc transferase